MSARKYWFILAGAALLTVILFVPGTSNPAPVFTSEQGGGPDFVPAAREGAGEQVDRILVNVSMSPEEYMKLKEANNRFMMKYPNSVVLINNIESGKDAYGSWKEKLQVGNAPDIMLMDSGWIQEFAVRGYLRSADGSAIADTLSNQPVKLLSPLKWNGYLWGIPYDADPYLQVWNRSKLEEEGLREPPADWTLYQSLVQKMQAADPELVPIHLTPGNLDQLLFWLDSWPSGGGKDAAYMTSGSAKAKEEQLRWLTAIAGWGGTTPPQPVNRLFVGSEMERRKQLSTVIRWSDYRALSEREQNKLVLDKSGLRHPWLNGRSFAVSAASEQPFIAFSWIKEMLSATVQEQNYQLSGRLPANNLLYGLTESGGYSSNRPLPPSWWLPLLNDDTAEPAPGPAWQSQRGHWEEQWRRLSSGAIDAELFLDSLIN
ncbi:extracellular solute-binding protein [Paenibacillus sp. NPDC058071]|uniref:extracellular solute-binding protein n=1 Tax=Paenibacillus sp. NPDC058071 TaxID=3346326 RepID=UPI0036D7BBDE